jgi:hypothetical protein
MRVIKPEVAKVFNDRAGRPFVPFKLCLLSDTTKGQQLMSHYQLFLPFNDSLM